MTGENEKQEIERAASDEAWRRLKGKHDGEPVARVTRAEWFIAGALWRDEQLKEILNHQAEIQSLWLLYPTITEHLLISALRHLHAVIEGDRDAAEAAKKIYWNVESEL